MRLCIHLKVSNRNKHGHAGTFHFDAHNKLYLTSFRTLMTWTSSYLCAFGLVVSLFERDYQQNVYRRMQLLSLELRSVQVWVK